jgi:hypothetical protein
VLQEVKIVAKKSFINPPPAVLPLTNIEPIPRIRLGPMGPALGGLGLFIYLMLSPENSLSDHSENDALKKMHEKQKQAALKKVDDLKKKGKYRGLTGGKGDKPGTELYDIDGEDYEDAVNDFKDIAGGVIQQIPGGYVGTTADGKNINVRDHSSEPNNAPTIEIFNPNTKVKEVKFRYNPNP